MKSDSSVICALCSHLAQTSEAKPLTAQEWGSYARALRDAGMRPSDLVDLPESQIAATLGIGADAAGRVRRLLDRQGSLAFALARYENTGIFVLTRADELYPRQLKHSLGNGCPPLLYCAGNAELTRCHCVGFVGSRDVSDGDEDFAVRAVEKVVERGFGVVSGGARGIDSIAGNAALACGAPLVEYVGHSLTKHVRRRDRLEALQDGQALVLSTAVPDANFDRGALVGRNKYIYGHSVVTIAVRSGLNHGGTWTGATEAMKKGLCPVLCWNNANYEGNQALISRGAVPIVEEWDGDVWDLAQTFEAARQRGGKVPGQTRLFD